MEIIKKFSGKYLFLANHYPREFFYQGISFKSLLNCWCWLLEKDEDHKKLIRTLTPYILTKDFDFKWLDVDILKDKDWHMRELVRKKFYDKTLKEQLDRTRGKVLVNEVWYPDRYWGIYRGKGENMLGRILMEVRDA